MPPSLLIVTAQEADYKTFNKLLALIHDPEYNDDEEFDSYYLLTRKQVPRLREIYEKDVDGELGTIPGSFNADNRENAWAGAAYEEVEDFWRENWGEPAMLKNHTCLLVLDDQGLTDETIIVAERQSEELDEAEMEGQDDEQPIRFNKVRVPWTDAHIMMMNLEVANMDFEDYCTDEGGENGWWKFQYGHYELTDKAVKRRNDKLAEMRKEGKI